MEAVESAIQKLAGKHICPSQNHNNLRQQTILVDTRPVKAYPSKKLIIQKLFTEGNLLQVLKKLNSTKSLDTVY